MAAFDPWAPCPDCKGAAVIRDFLEKGRDHTDVCGACGGTGFARLRDPECFGRVRVPAHNAAIHPRYVRLAEAMLEELRGGDAPFHGESRARVSQLAGMLRDFEAFVRGAGR